MDDASMSRILVDREADWVRVKDNVVSSIAGIMESRLSTLPGGKDGPTAQALRKELEVRLGKVQEQMFDMSRYNLQVNGQNYEDFVDATEGFDESLDRNVWAMQEERVNLETTVTERRRKVPEGIYNVEEDLELRRVDVEWLPDEAVDEAEQSKAADIPAPPRHEEVKQTFQTVVDNLAEVAKSAPVQLQRAQRAQTVRDEISSLPP